MADFDNTNRGVLFRNSKKEQDSHPDYTGKINVEGVDWELSAWIKDSKAGIKFFSISVRPPYKPKEDSKPKPKESKGFINDDIPF